MIEAIGVRFQQAGKVYYFDPNGLSPQLDDGVIVETARGIEYGIVAMESQQVEEGSLSLPLKPALRMATDEDLKRVAEVEKLRAQALQICERKIIDHKLDMKLVDTEVAFDNSKILFYFTADGRVDFRDLVKDLASTFRMRIELRQIGVRDETKMLGGLGPCGRPCCCALYMREFHPVSIKMAKEQGLSLNPTKISGLCGRLMCCLKYEQDHYEQTHKRMPRIGKEVRTPDGVGFVMDQNALKDTVRVRIVLPDGVVDLRDYPTDSVSLYDAKAEPSQPTAHAEKPEAPAVRSNNGANGNAQQQPKAPEQGAQGGAPKQGGGGQRPSRRGGRGRGGAQQQPQQDGQQQKPAQQQPAKPKGGNDEQQAAQQTKDEAARAAQRRRRPKPQKKPLSSLNLPE